MFIIPRKGSPVVLRYNTPECAYENTMLLLDQPVLPRAIFCTSDLLAVGVMKAIQAKGLRVPEDVAVCGYDNVEAAYLADPPITTIAVDRIGIGHEAVKLLKTYIDNPNLPSKTVCLKNQLVVRGSTVPANK